jgi:hypothetical protein
MRFNRRPCLNPSFSLAEILHVFEDFIPSKNICYIDVHLEWFGPIIPECESVPPIILVLWDSVFYIHMYSGV